MQSHTESLRIAIPGKGRLADGTRELLAGIGWTILRPSPRCYFGCIQEYPDIEVLFLRACDIPRVLAEGRAIIGITGYDIWSEYSIAQPNVSSGLTLCTDSLEFGACSLQVAVPDAWTDVQTCTDLQKHFDGTQMLRVATPFPALAQQFLAQYGMERVQCIAMQGALEAAPRLGIADIILDITASGTTLQANGLRPLIDGCVLRSQACVIANKRLLEVNKATLHPLLRWISVTHSLSMVGAGFISV